MTFRETFTYRGRVLGELIIPDVHDEAVTTEISRWSYWWHRVTGWMRRG